MRKLRLVAGLMAGLMGGTSAFIVGAAPAVEIEYWQYIFETRVTAMDQLIAEFEKANPDITVKQVTFPYDDYQTRIIAANMAGQGPDVMQFFYGWADQFIGGNLIQPLSKEAFPPQEIERDFFSIVTAMKRGDDYYGLPTAVRSLALFYNKQLFADAGLDPDSPPQTLDELIAAAEKIVQRDNAGNIVVAGVTLDVGGQDHHWWREVLLRQFGGQPYNDDNSQVAYDSEAGVQSLKFYTDLQLEQKVGQAGFMDQGQAAFRGGRAGMTIDGTFRLGSFSSTDFEWGVTELPANAQGMRSNYASYFANGISARATGEKLEAAEKFLNFISSPQAMEIWLETVGELPARRDVALSETNLNHPIFSPFLKGLDYAHTTLFVDEAAQRQVTMDMFNRIFLAGESAEASLKQAAQAEQRILDENRQ